MDQEIFAGLVLAATLCSGVSTATVLEIRGNGITLTVVTLALSSIGALALVLSTLCLLFGALIGGHMCFGAGVGLILSAGILKVYDEVCGPLRE